jgi:hypothetical protein
MKDIKDYLHLYLGSECFSDTGVTVRRLITLSLLQKSEQEFASITPILRPLSDMTEEEKINLFTLSFGNHRFTHFGYDPIECIILADKDERIRVGLSVNSMSADAFRFCLARGFDLFGLIEDGLAIDKTTLKEMV